MYNLKPETLEQVNTHISSLVKSWHVLRQIERNWNLKNLSIHQDKIQPLIEALPVNWAALHSELESLNDNIRAHINTPDYIAALESALAALAVPISGSFPNYELPPFRLNLNVESFEAKLFLGRKNERCSDLQPEQLAQWVAVRYKKLQNRKFNAPAFLKDLLEAWKIAVALHYPAQAKNEFWNLAVPLQDIYNLLTLKASARQEYPRQFFLYDLGLLKESGQTKLNDLHFDLGSARNQSKAFIIVDSQGRESHVSSLTVFKRED